MDELSLRGKPIIGQLAHELIDFLADVKVGGDNKYHTQTGRSPTRTHSTRLGHHAGQLLKRVAVDDDMRLFQPQLRRSFR